MTAQVSMDEQVAKLINHRIPTAYCSIQRQYIKLATQYGWRNQDKSIWPISVDNILKFLAFKAAEVAPHTLKTYISGLAYLHKITKHFSWDKEVGRHPSVLMLLKNTIRIHEHNKPTQSQHLTYDMLKLIRRKLDLNQEDHLLLWAICTIAFHTMAQLTELVAASANDTENVVTLESVRIEEVGGEMGASILLPRSKTHDPAVPAVLCIDATVYMGW